MGRGRQLHELPMDYQQCKRLVSDQEIRQYYGGKGVVVSHRDGIVYRRLPDNSLEFIISVWRAKLLIAGLA